MRNRTFTKDAFDFMLVVYVVIVAVVFGCVYFA